MPIIEITSSKFFSQYKNGSDFSQNLTDYSTNLVGLAGEKVKAVFDVAVEWYANATSVSTWDVQADSITLSVGVWSRFGF